MFKPLMSLCPGLVSRRVGLESFVFPYPKFVCLCFVNFLFVCFALSAYSAFLSL